MKSTPEIPLKKIISQTLGSLFYPEVVLLLVLPIFISVVLVSFILWVSWGFWTGLYSQGLQLIDPSWQSFLGAMPHFMAQILTTFRPVIPILAMFLFFAMTFPLVIVVNLVITSILTSGFLVKLIVKRDFPDLQKSGKPRLVLSLWNTFGSAILYVGLWVVSLPLWFIPGAQLVLPIVLTAWLNRRICTFDALTDFATDEELSALKKDSADKGYVVGLMTAGLNYIPFTLIISPVMTMVAFIYLGLGSLQNKRQV